MLGWNCERIRSCTACRCRPVPPPRNGHRNPANITVLDSGAVSLEAAVSLRRPRARHCARGRRARPHHAGRGASERWLDATLRWFDRAPGTCSRSKWCSRVSTTVHSSGHARRSPERSISTAGTARPRRASACCDCCATTVSPIRWSSPAMPIWAWLSTSRRTGTSPPRAAMRWQVPRSLHLVERRRPADRSEQ